jgi:MoaA/NifB/PqqE/SkfB family radical SAM enzyme
MLYDQDLGEAVQVSPKDLLGTDPFSQVLSTQSLKLKRDRTTTLQINVGLLCNQSCRHCHLDAGPNRREIMDLETAEAVIAYARRSRFGVIDITGGAPEMNPNIISLIEELSPLAPRLMVRSNLTALQGTKGDNLIDL